MQEPKPFSAEFDRLYAEYLGAGAPGSWEAWVAAREEPAGEEDAPVSYMVTLYQYQVDDAASPEEAARIAWDMSREPAAYAPMAQVTDQDGNTTLIDLEESGD